MRSFYFLFPAMFLLISSCSAEDEKDKKADSPNLTSGEVSTVQAVSEISKEAVGTAKSDTEESDVEITQNLTTGGVPSDKAMSTISKDILASASAGKMNARADTPESKQGKKMFNYWCSTCHAPEMFERGLLPGTASLAVKYKGELPAALEHREDLQREYIQYVIRHGSEGMPFFRKTEVSDSNMEAIAAYLSPNKPVLNSVDSEQSKKKLKNKDKVLTSDSLTGMTATSFSAVNADALLQQSAKDIYVNTCSVCHGTRLQGSQGPSLRDVKYRYGTDDEVVAKSIHDGQIANGMPAFGDVLSSDEIQSMVEFLASKRKDYDPVYLTRLDTQVKEKIRNTLVHSELHDFRIEIVAELGLPLSITALPDGRLLVTEEKTGKLREIENGKLLENPIKNTPEGTPSDIFKRVLIDVMAHPDYEKNGWIYLTSGSSVKSADSKEISTLRLIRGRIKNHTWVDSELLFTLPRDTAAARIAFDDQGYLYLTVSSDLSVDYSKRPDPFTRAELVKYPSQDINNPEGKIYRFHDDGSVPTDNPFADSSDNLATKVWSYGHRNAQGLAFDSKTKKLWSTEHGPRGGDELNIVLRGRNYGWPVITYGNRYDGVSISRDVKLEGLQAPIINWTPSIGVSNILFYSGDKFAHWKNDLLVGSMVQQELMRVRLDDNKAVVRELLISDIGRIRDIELGADGHLYLLQELKTQGLVLRLIPVEK